MESRVDALTEHDGTIYLRQDHDRLTLIAREIAEEQEIWARLSLSREETERLRDALVTIVASWER